MRNKIEHTVQAKNRDGVWVQMDFMATDSADAIAQAKHEGLTAHYVTALGRKVWISKAYRHHLSQGLPDKEFRG